MIQPEELMRGNLLNFRGRFVKIDSYEFDDVENKWAIYFDNFCSSHFLETFKPIELTPEILIRLGFEKYTFKVENKNQNTSDILFKIEIGTKRWMIITCQNNFGFSFPMLKDENSNNHYYLKGISYLHQLQNLVSVLTGKQLTLKEE